MLELRGGSRRNKGQTVRRGSRPHGTELSGGQGSVPSPAFALEVPLCLELPSLLTSHPAPSLHSALHPNMPNSEALHPPVVPGDAPSLPCFLP